MTSGLVLLELDRALAYLAEAEAALELRLDRLFPDPAARQVGTSSPAGALPVAEAGACRARVSSLETERAGEPAGSRRVLFERWRPLTFHQDGTVELGEARSGPARSDELFPPVTVRLTDAALAALERELELSRRG